jgi:hypothetical protein
VVLEGPPEMGKTAIAWMIAAVQLAQKWEAVDCDSPDDFFDGYENSDRQVFVADDAFGTTEYETTRGSNWGRQLHKILPKLNAKHWLVWTSRGHILNKALQEMSLQGKATSFPKPAEVIVNASKIDRRERALILYRHARAAALEDVAKNIVRQNAATIIDNSHFTPERIKRFVLEELPDLSQALINGEMEAVDVPDRIDRAIEHPTERMEKAFAKLDSGQKWLLIALLDCERSPNLKDLESVYRRFWEMQRPMEDEVHLLEEGFLLITAGSGSTLIDWIHPSYRDLVIDELEKNETAALRFLERCSLPGIRLAVSVAGGATGDRRFPLMSTPKSWDILQKRVLELINQSADEFVILSLLGTLRTGIAAAIDEPTILSHLSGILNQCCQEAKVQLDKTNKSIWPILLKAIFRSTIELTPPPPMPSMYASLKKVEDEFAENLRLAEDDKSRLDASTVEDWADTVSVIAKSDQRLLIQSGFPDAYGSRIEKLCLLVVSEIDTDPPLDSDDAFESQITRMRDLSGALEELVGMIPKLDKRLRRISRKAEKRAKALQKRHAETLSGGESEEELPDELRRNQPFDLDRLFADL